LYYLNFGNANLKPERAHTFNLGTTYSIPASVLAFTVDAFYHRTQNQILAVQTSPFTISAQNIEDVQTFGVETSIRAALWEHFSLQANYTFQRASNETPQSFVQGRQLIYTPQHLASGIMEYKQAWFSAVFTGQFVGERFFLPSNSVESRLAPFFIGNVAVEGTLTIASTQGRIRLLCDNCFNAEYAVIRNFPMPARAFRASLTLSL
jgi:outer membrane receptor protein involved in Fe transport